MAEVSAPPFISRADLGNVLGQDLMFSDKALIAIDSACDIVRDIAEQTFNLIEDEEIVLDGTGTDALLLPERPVTEITSVTVGDTELVVDDDWVLNDNGVLFRIWPAVWPSTRQSITVVYSHGYEDDSFPRSVRLVALEIAANLFQQQAGTSGEITREKIGSYEVAYSSGGNSTQGGIVTDNHDRILTKYRQAK